MLDRLGPSRSFAGALLLAGCTTTACAYGPDAAFSVGERADAHAPVTRVPSTEPSEPLLASARGRVRAFTMLDPLPPARLLSTAVGHGRVGVGWTAVSPLGETDRFDGRAYFAIADEQLESVQQVQLPNGPSRSIAVAPWRDGWVVATGNADGGFTLTPVDAEGHAGGRTWLDGRGQIAVAPRGDEQLLAVEFHVGRVHATLFHDLEASPAWELTLAEIGLGSTAQAVAVDDGFLVAYQNQSAVEVVHLDPEGAVTHRSHDAGPRTEFPQLASCGDHASLVWGDFSGPPKHADMYFASLDATGGFRREATWLGGTPEYFKRSPVLCGAERSVVLLSGYTGTGGSTPDIDLRSVRRSGRVGRLQPVLPSRSETAACQQLAWLGDDVLVSWIGDTGAIALARVEPPR